MIQQNCCITCAYFHDIFVTIAINFYDGPITSKHSTPGKFTQDSPLSCRIL